MNPDQQDSIEDIQFDEFGQYEVMEITDDQLDLISGGDTININCPCEPMPLPNRPPPPPPHPPPPKPNKTCGEDGDEE